MSNRQNLEDIGSRILNASRTELYLSMRFMGSALDSLGYIMDLNTRTVGTDAVYIRFNPDHLLKLYMKYPKRLNRLYIHMILHCIFRHMFNSENYEDAELYDLCADITVESVLDTMDYKAVATINSDFREETYAMLNDAVKVITAERLYQYFTENPPDPLFYGKLTDEFTKDDHSFWQRLQDQKSNENGDQNPPDEQDPNNGNNNDPDDDKQPSEEAPPKEIQELEVRKLPKELEEEWKKQAERVKIELEAAGNEAADDRGSLLRTLRFVLKRRRGYQHFLKRFSAMHEETKIDMDSFDYGFYQYGISLYGNIPLIEENEYRESRKIRTLAIAIDTSASCQESLVQRFLNETADILMRQETFFKKSEILLIECDDQVQEEIWLKDPAELKKYAEGFKIRGGFGTDFRPVFTRLEDLRSKGRLRNLKGMMYFTDGYGKFPEKAPAWETAFVLFKDEDCEKELIPNWAYTLYLEGN